MQVEHPLSTDARAHNALMDVGNAHALDEDLQGLSQMNRTEQLALARKLNGSVSSDVDARVTEIVFPPIGNAGLKAKVDEWKEGDNTRVTQATATDGSTSTTWRNPNGDTTNMDVDSQHKVTSVTKEWLELSSDKMSAIGVTQKTDANGNITTNWENKSTGDKTGMTTDSNGNVVAKSWTEKGPDGRPVTVSQTYDKDGHPTSTTWEGADGNKTTMTTRMGPDGTVITVSETRNAAGELASTTETDHNGKETTTYPDGTTRTVTPEAEVYKFADGRTEYHVRYAGQDCRWEWRITPYSADGHPGEVRTEDYATHQYLRDVRDGKRMPIGAPSVAIHDGVQNRRN